MKNDVNLWNVGNGKTRLVLEFIEGLEPRKEWELHQIKKFDTIKLNAQEDKLTNDQRLQTIGYVPQHQPRIYHWAKT